MNYEYLFNIIHDKDRVRFGKNIEEKYLSDGLKRVKGVADILVFPLTTEEVSDVMKFAYENNISVTPRGAGTGLVGATISTTCGIILDLSLMNKIVELDEDNLTITVEPGILLKNLQAYVEERELFYPPDPGEKDASIGGNISTNAGGMRAVKYGVTRDYVRGLEVVLANGDIMNLGGKVIKDSSGLDLKDLIIGSEGTLAIVTKAILKLIPKPKKSISALISFESLHKGIDAVIKIIKKNANPTAIEFVEKDVIQNAEKYLNLKFPDIKGQAFLLLTFDGDEELEIESNYNKVREVTLESGAIDFILLNKKEDIDRTWQIRGALVTAIEAVSEQEPIDIVVPINKTADFISYTKVAEKKFGIKIKSFGHAGDGNVHLCVIRDGMEEEEWNEKSHLLLKALYNKGKELQGLPSGEHGIGLNKKPYFLEVTDRVNIEYMRKIKKVFDEKGILNPNKLYE
ncbi:2-hydroxy-acid oxidase [Clostridium polyendosporum]|uniref:2-hydroxy-acid oxidase n=1 Tax=Clostridium polyendosporum TaxID=69208 RepID=A0A919S2N4_9CLOT|nr:FAD-binding oxidoreductase [Clostridium polyendosporum]GIM30130.1 2-hydroxy-acid oxidase [Clostridium polyendosporum]